MRQAKVRLRDAMPENSLFSRVMQDLHSFPIDKNEVEVFCCKRKLLWEVRRKPNAHCYENKHLQEEKPQLFASNSYLDCEMCRLPRNLLGAPQVFAAISLQQSPLNAHRHRAIECSRWKFRHKARCVVAPYL